MYINCVIKLKHCIKKSKKVQKRVYIVYLIVRSTSTQDRNCKCLRYCGYCNCCGYCYRYCRHCGYCYKYCSHCGYHCRYCKYCGCHKHCKYCRSDIMNVVDIADRMLRILRILRRCIQSVTEVSYNSTPPFKLKLLQDGVVVVLGGVYRSLLWLVYILQN